jgi:ABC-2 type transport system permease protein
MAFANARQAAPMSVNEMVIAPLFGNIAVIGLFLIPLISMRLFAEEKRQGTIELLVTSPVHDLEIVIGKWLAAVLMYSALLGVSASRYLVALHLRLARLEAGRFRFRRPPAARRRLLAFGAFISTLTKNQIVAGAVGFGLPCCSGF